MNALKPMELCKLCLCYVAEKLVVDQTLARLGWDCKIPTCRNTEALFELLQKTVFLSPSGLKASPESQLMDSNQLQHALHLIKTKTLLFALTSPNTFTT